jgi:cytochrome P450
VRNGGSLTDNDVATEFSNLLLTDLDTTANTLFYRFWLLSKVEYTNSQERVRKEVTTINVEDDI